MKKTFSFFADLLAPLAFTAFSIVFFINFGQDIRNRHALLEHGVRIDASLQNAAHHHRRWWFDCYTLTVTYLNETRTLDADAGIFAQHVQGGRFRAGEPVAIAYLPEKPHVAQPAARLNKSLWQHTENLTNLFFGTCFLILALILYPHLIDTHFKKDKT